MYGSETESCVSTRGEYYFPVEEERDNWRETLQVSSYDLAAAPWGYPPDYELKAQEECPFIMGEFVWTGFDYLGEPTPYKQEWPSRSSYFGIIDLCGFPKDRYYLYQSQWSEKKVLHLLPHWNWEGREGEITPVHCYTNYEAAELFLNGRSLGIRRKNPDGLFDRYRLIWEDVRYEPGSLKVAAYDQHGQIAAEKEVKTAGSPAQILLLPDRTTISNDRRDLSFMTVKIVDDEGDLCPLADNLVQFRLNGPGEIVAVDNGDPTGLEPFIADYRRAFHGLCLLVVKAVKDASGEIRISASSENLQGSETVIVC
jgi:beta-galactosidase